MKYASLEMIFKHCEFAHFLVGKKKIWTLDFFWVQRPARKISLCTSPWGKVKCGKNARWLSVWCETYDVSFGHVLFPTSLKWIQLPTYFGVGSCTIGTSRQKIYWIVLHRASSSKKSWDWVSSSASCLDSCLADENAQDQNDKHDK